MKPTTSQFRDNERPPFQDAGAAKAPRKRTSAPKSSVVGSVPSRVVESLSPTTKANTKAKPRAKNPPEVKEQKEEQYPKKRVLGITKDMDNRLEQQSKETDVPVAVFIRRLIEREFSSTIPILGDLPCGPLQEAIEKADQVVVPGQLLNVRPGDVAFRAKGDSNEPRILDGDLVLIRPDVKWMAGEICAVQVFDNPEHEGDCKATLKRVFQPGDGSELLLKPINPKHNEFRVPAANAVIIGVYRGRCDHDNI